MLTITSEQALATAPDANSAQAGRKLADPRHWRNLGHTPQALWGECQGSALYQTRVDLASLSVKCSCPSRKFPCKHGVGLMLLAATTPDALPESAPPDWVAAWLNQRAARAEAEATPKAPAAPKDDAKAAAAATKRIGKREGLVSDGLDMLDLWLHDLMRGGLGAVEAQPARFWYDMSKRMVDAQAGGMAGRLRAMAGIVNTGRDWPQRLLDALGETALLSHAYHQQATLDAALRADVRSLVGWSLSTDEVDAAGDHVRDQWITLGQTIFEDDHLRTQRTWLLGEQSARTALILQFSVGWRDFGETFVRGSRFQAELHFWPGAYPLRARIASRPEVATPQMMRWLPHGLGYASIDALLGEFARALGRQPWLGQLGVALRDVTPIPTPEGPWLLRDAAGAALPLAGDDHWPLLALSGGRPLDLLAEWNGARLLPLGAFAEGRYSPLEGRTA